MRRARRLELAALLREHEVSLKRALDDAAERSAPFTAREATRIVADVERRLEPIETALREQPAVRLPLPVLRLLAPVRRLATRLRGLRAPRLGRLRHYEPRPLVVPASYRQTALPAAPPQISIVTPSFQHCQFIGRTIESVLTQEYPNLEFIVQDAGSDDGTVEVLEGFGDSIDWRSECDRGHADGLNRGFARATGEIMGWLNSDDLLLPGALACIASFFSEHPDVDVVYGNRLMIDEDDREVGAWILPGHDDAVLTLADFVPQETLFWRRRVWEAAGAYLDESFEYALDWDLLLRFREVGATMVHLPRFLGAFRVHDEQRTSAAFSLGQAEMMRLRERVYRRPVPLAEVQRHIRPYLRRHVRAHLRHRLRERMTSERVTLVARAIDEPQLLRLSART